MKLTRENIAASLINNGAGQGNTKNYVQGQVREASSAVLKQLSIEPSTDRVYHDQPQSLAVLDEIEFRLTRGSTKVKANLTKANITIGVLRLTEAEILGL